MIPLCSAPPPQWCLSMRGCRRLGMAMAAEFPVGWPSPVGDCPLLSGLCASADGGESRQVSASGLALHPGVKCPPALPPALGRTPAPSQTAGRAGCGREWALSPSMPRTRTESAGRQKSPVAAGIRPCMFHNPLWAPFTHGDYLGLRQEAHCAAALNLTW